MRRTAGQLDVWLTRLMEVALGDEALDRQQDEKKKSEQSQKQQQRPRKGQKTEEEICVS